MNPRYCIPLMAIAVSPALMANRAVPASQVPVALSTRCEAPGEVCFIAFGDHGTLGRDRLDRNQYGVADAMTQWQLDHETQFVIGLGDNFYLGAAGLDGVFGCDNPAFKERFEDVYALMPQTFYMIAGNHDWVNTTPRSLLCYAKTHRKWYQPYFYYRFRTADVEFFALDTELILKEVGTLAIHEYGADEAELKWLDRALGDSTARWKIVYGHHPIFSNGKYNDNGELKRKLLPILKRHYVDLYLSGHDHNQQHITRVDTNIDFVVTGAGGRALETLSVGNPFEPNVLNNTNLVESRQHGFAYIRISGARLHLTFVNANAIDVNAHGMAVPYKKFYEKVIPKLDGAGSHSVRLERLANLCPRLVRGDREFDGNGPQVRGTLTLGISPNGNRLTATVTFKASETGGDRSEAEGTWTFDVGEPAPPDMRYTRIIGYPTSTFTRTLRGGGRNEVTGGCDGNVHVVAPGPGGPVRSLRIVGDTGGTDISSDHDCTCDTRIAEIEFKPVTVELGRR